MTSHFYILNTFNTWINKPSCREVLLCHQHDCGSLPHINTWQTPVEIFSRNWRGPQWAQCVQCGLALNVLYVMFYHSVHNSFGFLAELQANQQFISVAEMRSYFWIDMHLASLFILESEGNAFVDADEGSIHTDCSW